jgi:hypothetical protein
MVEWAGAGGARSINKYYVDEAVMEMEAQERRCHAWVGSDGPLNGRTDDLLGTGARAPVRVGAKGHASAGAGSCPAVANAHAGAGATADARLVHGSGDTDRGTKGERQHNDNHQGQGGGVRHANSSMLRR